jgi:hypothetical protein
MRVQPGDFCFATLRGVGSESLPGDRKRPRPIGCDQKSRFFSLPVACVSEVPMCPQVCVCLPVGDRKLRKVHVSQP